jgi:hypothetical protein
MRSGAADLCQIHIALMHFFIVPGLLLSVACKKRAKNPAVAFVKARYR